MSKSLAAIVRYERAAQNLSSLTHRIGRALGGCPISQSFDGQDPSLIDEMNRVKTHLWQAFRITETSSCGWGSVHLDEEGIRDALGDTGPLECRNCLEAFELIQLRKKARQEMGIATRAIRSIGRAELKRIES